MPSTRTAPTGTSQVSGVWASWAPDASKYGARRSPNANAALPPAVSSTSHPGRPGSIRPRRTPPTSAPAPDRGRFRLAARPSPGVRCPTTRGRSGRWIAGSRSNTVVDRPQPENSTRLWLGRRSSDVGSCRMIHSAREAETFGRRIHGERPPRGALPDCIARTDSVAVVRPNDAPSNQDSAQAVKRYSSPSASPGRSPPPRRRLSRTARPRARCRSAAPSRRRPDAALARAVTVEVPSPFDAEVSTRRTSSGAPMPFADTVVARAGRAAAEPGGSSNREYGVMVIGVAEFVPTRYDGTSRLVWLGRQRDPHGLARWRS